MPWDMTPAEAPAETETDVYSIEALARWLARQPQDAIYDDWSISDCLICQYGKAHGIKPDLAGFYFAQSMDPWCDAGLNGEINRIAYYGETSIAAALSRAVSYLAKRRAA